MKWISVIATTRGDRQEQQDAVELFTADNRLLLAMGDGLGGHSGGARASQALTSIADDHFHRLPNGETAETLFESIIRSTHDQLIDLRNTAGTTPRTTALLLYITDRHAWWAHLGDTRLYHFRQGRLQTRTHDHSITQLLVDTGKIQEDEMGEHPDQGKLLRSLGGKDLPELDVGDAELQAGDTFVICTDGYWEHTTTREVARLSQGAPTQRRCDAAVETAVKRAGGDADNATLAVLHTPASKRERPVIEFIRRKLHDIFTPDHSRRHRRLAVGGILLAALLAIASNTASAISSSSVQTIDRSVFRLFVTTNGGKTFTGSAFAVTGTGILVTNRHVVEDSESVTVLQHGGKPAAGKSAEVLWRDPATDLALLYAKGISAPALRFPAHPPEKGDGVIAIGFPGEPDSLGNIQALLESTVTEGIVGRVFNGSWETDSSIHQIIQHSASINSGNSGGPLLNTCGEVIGINTAIPPVRLRSTPDTPLIQVTSGINYSLSSSELMAILDRHKVPYERSTFSCPPPTLATINQWMLVAIIATMTMAILLAYHFRKRSRRPQNDGLPTGGKMILLGSSRPPRSLQVHTTLSNGTTKAESISAASLVNGVILGRQRERCQVSIPDETVSRRHLKITMRERTLYIEDLGSSSGTVFAGKRLAPHVPLKIRSKEVEILAGDTRILLTLT